MKTHGISLLWYHGISPLWKHLKHTRKWKCWVFIWVSMDVAQTKQFLFLFLFSLSDTDSSLEQFLVSSEGKRTWRAMWYFPYSFLIAALLTLYHYIFDVLPMYLRIRHLFNPPYNCCYKNSCAWNAQMPVCCQDEWAVDTELSSHVVHGNSPHGMTARLLANAQLMLWSRLLFLSLFKMFYSCLFCHSSWDLNNDGTDLISRDSISLGLQLLWSLARGSSCACGLASFLTYQRHCSEMTGGKLALLALHQKCWIQAAANGFETFFYNDSVTVPVIYNWCM